jgi:hypothetical protein
MKYTEMVNPELKESIIRCKTSVSIELKSVHHEVLTNCEWSEEQKEELVEYLDRQYTTSMWTYESIRGTFYIGSPRMV